MKTYKNLYPRIHSFANLYLAFRAARKAKRDRAEVAAFEFDLENNLLALQTELEGQTYCPRNVLDCPRCPGRYLPPAAAPFCRLPAWSVSMSNLRPRSPLFVKTYGLLL